MAIGDIVQVTIEGEIDGQKTNNVLHFRATDLLLGSETTLAQGVLDCVKNSLLPGISVDWKVLRVRARKIYPTAGLEYVVDGGGINAGSAGGSLPSFNAAIISLRTATGGRSGKGRMYIAGLPTNGEDKSKLSALFTSVLASFITCMVSKFITAPLTSGFNWGIVSRKKQIAAPNDPSQWFMPVTQAVINTDVGTMRSRKIGYGS
ncbi:MAG: hypothetical protein ACOVQN_07070 [Exiguobacterium sp.]